MGLVDEIIAVVAVAIILTFIGVINYTFWSFLFALLFSTVIATWIGKRFAGNQKTLGSNGRYVKTSNVYLFVVIGIIASSFAGSAIANYLTQIFNQSDFWQLFSLSFFVAFTVYAYVKFRLY